LEITRDYSETCINTIVRSYVVFFVSSLRVLRDPYDCTVRGFTKDTKRRHEEHEEFSVSLIAPIGFTQIPTFKKYLEITRDYSESCINTIVRFYVVFFVSSLRVLCEPPDCTIIRITKDTKRRHEEHEGIFSQPDSTNTGPESLLYFLDGELF